MKRKCLKTIVVPVMLASLCLQLLSCGTIMYPERKGQTGGKIDPGVAVLDGLGLLLFLIPGVIAFAVDFSNGTIYYPRGGASLDDESGEDRFVALRLPADLLTEEVIEAALEEELGKTVELTASGLQVIELDSLEAARKHLPAK